MLGAVEENINDFVDHLKQHICDLYGLEIWREAVKKGMTKEARAIITGKLKSNQVVDKDDFLYYAEEFCVYHQPRIEQLVKRVKAREEEPEQNFSSSAHGSLQNLTAYQTLLPQAIKIRQRLTGQREPLDYEDALGWLKRESQTGMPVMWEDITFRLRVPNSVRSQSDDYTLGTPVGQIDLHVPELTEPQEDVRYPENETPEEFAAWLQRKLERQVPSEYDDLRQNYLHPIVWQQHRYASFLHEPGGIELNRGKLVELAEAAEYFLPLTRNITRGVWLILTGYWQRLGVQSVHEMPVRHYYSDHRVARGIYPQIPCTLEIGEWETSPEELAAYYAKIKQMSDIKSKTRVLTYESEVIALAALELIKLHGVYKGDRGFYRQVLEHFERRAFLYGIDPYTDFAGASTRAQRPDAIRHALIRVEKVHREIQLEVIKRYQGRRYLSPLFVREHKNPYAE